MARNRVIRPRDADAIANLIRSWPRGKLSWNEVCKKCGPILSYVPTRQGLSKHQVIAEAFQAKKAGIRISPDKSSPAPSSLAVASRRIALLNATVSEVNKKYDRMIEQFIVWQYNAYKRGLTQDQLDEPIPTIDREVNE